MTVRALIFALLFSAATCAAFAQQPEPAAARRITLREAVDLALAHNHVVRLAQLSVDEKDRAKDVARSDYFPQVRNETTVVHVTDTQLVEIPAGGLGVVGVTAVPPQTLILNQGGVSTATNGTGVVQPLTQLFRVKAANDVARAEAEATRAKARLMSLACPGNSPIAKRRTPRCPSCSSSRATRQAAPPSKVATGVPRRYYLSRARS